MRASFKNITFLAIELILTVSFLLGIRSEEDVYSVEVTHEKPVKIVDKVRRAQHISY